MQTLIDSKHNKSLRYLALLCMPGIYQRVLPYKLESTAYIAGGRFNIEPLAFSAWQHKYNPAGPCLTWAPQTKLIVHLAN